MKHLSDDIVLVEGNNELNVAMTPVAVVIAGEILELSWSFPDDVELIEWHPMSEPISYQASYYQRFKIKNTGSVAASFRAAYYREDYGAGYRYSQAISLAPGEEGYIHWSFWAGAPPGVYETTWYLFAGEEIVDSMIGTVIISQ